MDQTLNPTAAKLKSSLEHSGALYALCYDDASKRLYGAGTDAAIYTVDLTAEKPTAEKRWTHHDNYVSCLTLHGPTLLSGGYDGRLIWTDTKTGDKIREVAAHSAWLRDLVVTPDGKHIATVGDDMLVKLWDFASGDLVHRMEGHATRTPEGYSTALYALAISPDGATLASGDRIGDVLSWETATGKQIGRLQAPTFYTFDAVKRARAIGGIRALCFSPDGKSLAIGGIGKVTNVDGFVGPCRVEVWDWQAGKRTFIGQDNHHAVLNQVAFHESLLVGAGGGDSGGVIAFWDLKNEKPIHKAKPKGHLHKFHVAGAPPELLAVGYGGFQIWSFDPAEKEKDDKNG